MSTATVLYMYIDLAKPKRGAPVSNPRKQYYIVYMEISMLPYKVFTKLINSH